MRPPADCTNRTSNTRARKTRFLEKFAKYGTVAAAAQAAKVARRSHYSWLESDPAYAKEFDEAKEAAIDRAEAELIRRGVDGWSEPIFQQGRLVGTVRKHSDLCLIRYLEAMRPERYRRRQMEPAKPPTDGDIAGKSDRELLEIARQVLARVGRTAGADEETRECN